MSESPPPETVGQAVQAALKEPSLHLGVGIVVGLFLTIIFVPLFGLVIGAFAPTPLIYFYYRRGRIFGLTLTGVAGILVILLFMMTARPYFGLFFFEFAALAIIMGECLGRRYPPGWIIGAPAVGALALVLILFAGIGLSRGVGPADFIKSAMQAQIKMAVQVSRAVSTGEPLPGTVGDSETAPGVQSEGEAETQTVTPTPRLDELEKDLDKLVGVFMAVSPAMMLMGAAVLAWVNFLLARSLLLRQNALAPELADLTTWQAPDKLVWFAIASGFGVWLVPGMIRVVSVNVLLVMFLVYFFQGLAVVAHWLQKKAVPPLVRGLIYAFIAFGQFMALIVAALGFFDIWLDFRKIKRADSGADA